jgi:hypothetical protein
MYSFVVAYPHSVNPDFAHLRPYSLEMPHQLFVVDTPTRAKTAINDLLRD